MKVKEKSRPVVVAHLEWLLSQGKRIEVSLQTKAKSCSIRS
jgi:hypothetical protein